MASTIPFRTLPTKTIINIAFTLLFSYQAKSRQPQVLDGDFISEDKLEVMTSKLFKEPTISKTMGGGAKGASVKLTMPTNEAYNHVKPLYVIVQFDGQPVSRVLVDNGIMLSVLLISILRKMGKRKSDILATNLIMINFYEMIA